ncbi:HTH-type transcriptional repressor YtrA [Microbacterium lemovicicum]|uniref:HTH-type transcriptional repressor YtrA n=1 Tax=Microbacterium lemovicicum TaxID=1072463 RepID=A0A3Q9J2T2_9MICO|nr:GntR family transcriptional regulator [Microbacterium lemovicicum]AZS36567.1 HTH-type transcriptional repressor YtrA [Microbacterium lemovicicum]
MTDTADVSGLRIDPASPLPPYEQLRIGVVDAVGAGRLVAGARLPAVRRLAEDLGVAPGTVARAYKELEAAGFVQTLGRNGTVISPQGDPARQQAQRAAAAFAGEMRSLRIGDDDARALVDAALRGGATDLGRPRA